MSSHKFRLELSPAAHDDWTAITHHTILNWGETQANLYHEKLEKALETIRLHSDIGHGHSDLPDFYRLYPVGSHVIVYRIRQEMISVMRILHQRMSLALHI